jgi:hypothetical protein
MYDLVIVQQNSPLTGAFRSRAAVVDQPQTKRWAAPISEHPLGRRFR